MMQPSTVQSVPTFSTVPQFPRSVIPPGWATQLRLASFFYESASGLVRLRQQFLPNFSLFWLDCQGLAECQALVVTFRRAIMCQKCISKQKHN
jgi:hypothetical protein